MHRMSAVLGVEEMYLLGYQILTGLNYFFNIMYMARRGFPFDLSIIFLWIALRMVRTLLTQVIYMFMGLW